MANCADEKHQEDFDFRTERDVSVMSRTQMRELVHSSTLPQALHALVKDNRKLRGCPILLVAHNISLTTRGGTVLHMYLNMFFELTQTPAYD